MEILPEAFAVIKETARRFTEAANLASKATDLDRDLAAKSDFIEIVGADAVYKKSWQAAGAEVVWNMVHYDVQLIGGIVLWRMSNVIHKKKLAQRSRNEFFDTAYSKGWKRK